MLSLLEAVLLVVLAGLLRFDLGDEAPGAGHDELVLAEPAARFLRDTVSNLIAGAISSIVFFLHLLGVHGDILGRV